MSETAAAVAGEVGSAAADRGSVLRRAWKLLTSFQLAVVLLGLSALLVFLGTLAQVHEGLYLAQERWFKSWWIVRRAGDIWWVPPVFPGGYTLGLAFLLNMMCAHFRRFTRPPGGMVAMLLHYAVVALALYVVTWKLLWMPWVFAFVCSLLLIIDLLLSRRGAMEGSGRKIGIDFVHLGIAILMVGQLATDMLATESQISFREGETARYSEERFDSELVFLKPADAANDEVVAIPHDLLKPGAAPLVHSKLPFGVRVRDWMPNSELVNRQTAQQQEGTLRGALAALESRYSNAESLPAEAARAKENPGRVAVWHEALATLGVPASEDIETAAKQIAGQADKAAALMTALRERFRREMLSRFAMQDAEMRFAAKRVEAGQPVTETDPPAQAASDVAQRYFTVPLPEARDMDSRNIPAAVVELTDGTGAVTGSWLVTPMLKAQEFDFGGMKWRVALRMARNYHPFSMTLLKTTHEVYPGTEIPKDFRSRVRIENPEQRENREVEIYMNAPLRYAGLTFFQYQMGRDELDRSRGTSALQVVRNPSWFSPYFGCSLVGYGMLRHFLLHLFRFSHKRRTA
jgi:hypothetical protein